MATAREHLTQLQQQLSEQDWPNNEVTFSETNGLFDVQYYGHSDRESLEPILETLCVPDVAASLKSLSFGGGDVGANGTRDWDFSPLFFRHETFRELKSLYIEPTEPEDGNRTIIESFVPYEESGQLARWLDRAPNLEELTAPSAPATVFFLRPPHPLRRLRLDAGYDIQDFIYHLALQRFSPSFPHLEELDWGDFHECYMDGWESKTTHFSYYHMLFDSPILPHRMTIRNPHLEPIEETGLHAMFKRQHPDGSFQILRTCPMHQG
jgi:hypothetical protein